MKRIFTRLVLVSSLLLFSTYALQPASANHHGGGATYIPAQWNGYRIFLSPAHHYQGDKQGCNGYIEDREMRSVAYEAAIGSGVGEMPDLQDR